MSGDQIQIDLLACDTIERAVVGGGIDAPEPGTADIGQTWTKAKAEQPKESKHNVRVRPYRS